MLKAEDFEPEDFMVKKKDPIKKSKLKFEKPKKPKDRFFSPNNLDIYIYKNKISNFNFFLSENLNLDIIYDFIKNIEEDHLKEMQKDESLPIEARISYIINETIKTKMIISYPEDLKKDVKLYYNPVQSLDKNDNKEFSFYVTGDLFEDVFLVSTVRLNWLEEFLIFKNCNSRNYRQGRDSVKIEIKESIKEDIKELKDKINKAWEEDKNVLVSFNYPSKIEKTEGYLVDYSPIFGKYIKNLDLILSEKHKKIYKYNFGRII